MSNCKYCFIKNTCTINPSTCNKEFSVFDACILAEREKKIRADAIDDVERELLANGFIITHHALEVWHEIAEQLKEQANDNL